MRREIRILLLTTLALTTACERDEATPSSSSAVSSAASGAVALSSGGTQAARRAADESQAAKPQQLLSLPTSAYHAAVALDGPTVTVLTPTEAHRLVPDGAQESLSIPADAAAALAGDSVVYWFDGMFWRASFGGGTKRIGVAPQRPVMLAANSEAFAWVDGSVNGVLTVHLSTVGSPNGSTAGASVGGELRSHSSLVPISALVMHDDAVSFVERLSDSTWRIGRVSTSDTPRFSSVKASRPPSMLALHRNELFYYGGLRWGLRASSADLDTERKLATQVVCSPLSVSTRIYCAQVQGLVELTKGGALSRVLTTNRGRLITSLVADAERVVWISDAGAERLEVEMITLPE